MQLNSELLQRRIKAGSKMTEKVIYAKGGQIIKLEDDLAEVIVSEGVGVTAEMVEESGRLLMDNFDCPCRVLINRKNSYSYSFDAQQRLANLDCVYSVAIQSHSRAGHVAARVVQIIPGAGRWKVSFFTDRNNALDWLEAAKNNRLNRCRN